MLAVTVVSPRMGSQGWPFAQVDPFPGADEDPLFHSEHVKDLYIKANPDYGGRSVSRCKDTADLQIYPHAQVHRPIIVGQEIAHDREQ
jgi:glutathionyl-hydroquinone reductase